MNDVKSTFDIINFLHKGWEKRSIILILLLSILLIGLYNCSSYVNIKGNTIKEIFPDCIPIRNILIIYCIIELVILAIWYFTRKLPKIKKNQIGVVFAIISENDKLKRIIKNDYINEIRKLIRNRTQKDIKVVSLSEYHSQKILKKTENAKKYRSLINANLIICGKFEIRENNKYLLDIKNVNVGHAEIDVNISIVFGREMAEVIPQKNIISIENELIGFQICSNFFGISAQYILGIASYLSGKIQEALEFHNTLLPIVQSYNSTTANEVKMLNKITSSTKHFVIEESLFFCRFFYSVEKNLEKLKLHLDIIEKIDSNNYPYLLFSAIYHFLWNRNISKSLELIEEAKNSRDFTWAYSKAFLIAYNGDLTEAYRIYKRAFNKFTYSSAFLQSEEFMMEVFEEEPDKIQLLYCMGLINYFKKEDHIIALEYFEKFKEESVSKNLFKDYLVYVEKYIQEIKSKYGA